MSPKISPEIRPRSCQASQSRSNLLLGNVDITFDVLLCHFGTTLGPLWLHFGIYVLLMRCKFGRTMAPITLESIHNHLALLRNQ